MSNLHISEVRLALEKATLQPTQSKLFLPRIARYMERLNRGQIPPAIKVDKNIIVEGHHRYVAGLLFGRLPDVIPGTYALSGDIYDWQDVVIDEASDGGE